MIGGLVMLACLAVADGPTVVVTQPDESKFPEITVYFEVRKPDGSFVLDAKAGEFRVAEGGQDRPILRFEAPESTVSRPTTVVLVVDHSGSMAEDDRIGAMKRAVASFLDGLPEGSRVAVLAFNNRIDLICPFTDDPARVRAAVDALEPEGGTRYYDAVATALDLLGEQPGRRAVLALTDGRDAKSREATPRSVVAEARRLGLPVHTLGLGKDAEKATQDLARLAEATRGQHYRAAESGQLGAIFEEIARRLGSSYSLTYRTDRVVADGTLRPIQIRYAEAAEAAETAVFIRGMVVPEPGWSRLYLAMMAGLGGLALLPILLRSRSRSLETGTPP